MHRRTSCLRPATSTRRPSSPLVNTRSNYSTCPLLLLLPARLPKRGYPTTPRISHPRPPRRQSRQPTLKQKQKKTALPRRTTRGYPPPTRTRQRSPPRPSPPPTNLRTSPRPGPNRPSETASSSEGGARSRTPSVGAGGNRSCARRFGKHGIGSRRSSRARSRSWGGYRTQNGRAARSSRRDEDRSSSSASPFRLAAVFPTLATNSVHVYCAMMIFEGNRQASIQTATDAFRVSALRVHGRKSCRTGGVSPRQQRDQLARFSSRERSKPVCIGHATSLSYFGRSPFAKLSRKRNL